ncbi:MAG TPA: ABC transporter ATP-binding protein [Chloroflexota bacterium]|nr:ABC transporter ATP-binding protein [Chloroflexota bacterium]
MAAIACRDLSFSYPNGVQALRAIELAVASGEFVSLIGPSGCGKSTLLRVVADLLPPDSGDVAIAGKPPRVSRTARRIAMVFQEPALLGWRRAARNVELPLELAAKRDAAAQHRARELLARVGLGDMSDRLPAQMSGGQRQRVAIARALIQEPEVLLMDEPFGALDQITRDEMNEALLRVWEDTRITVLFVTHSIAEAVYLSDRVAVFTPRPGTLRSIIDIPLPRPRLHAIRRDPAFFHLENRVLAALEGQSEDRQESLARHA